MIREGVARRAMLPVGPVGRSWNRTSGVPVAVASDVRDAVLPFAPPCRVLACGSDHTMNVPHGTTSQEPRMARTQKITTHLWFNGNAEAAVEFYTSVFPDLKITN